MKDVALDDLIKEDKEKKKLQHKKKAHVLVKLYLGSGW